MDPPWAASRCHLNVGRRLSDDLAANLQGKDDGGACVDDCVCKAWRQCTSLTCWRPQLDECNELCLHQSQAAIHQSLALISAIITWASLVGQFFFMVRYQRDVMAKKPKLPDVRPEVPLAGHRGFRTSIVEEFCSALSCLFCQSQDASLCLHSTFCRGVRMSDTYTSAGLEGFYCNGLMYFTTLFALPVALSLNFMWGRLAFAFLFVVKRRQLRHRLSGYEESCKDFFVDFMLLLCCTPCVACQEARHVDDTLGIRVECCCRLVDAQEPATPLVGVPVTTAHGAAPGQPRPGEETEEGREPLE